MIVAQKEGVHIPALGVIKARGRDLPFQDGAPFQGRVRPPQHSLRNAVNHKG